MNTTRRRPPHDPRPAKTVEVTDGAVFGVVTQYRPASPWFVHVLETRRSFPSWDLVENWLNENGFQVYEKPEKNIDA